MEGEAGRFAARAVELGPRAHGQVVAASGVRPGERVVVQGAMALLGELGLAAAGKPRPPER